MKPAYVMPGGRPESKCENPNPARGEHYRFPCNRRKGHGGRHAFVWWGVDKRVRAVWGER